MYRYQASFPECYIASECKDATKMTNWICFGTKENCGTNDDNIDKYMYRIIGITDEGQLYLIKETVLKEGSQKFFAWNDKFSVDSSRSEYCDNGLCPEWNTSLLFKRINGTSNGDIPGSGDIYSSTGANTDIFVDSREYEYLKSGDTNSGGSASDWYNLIADHEWMYGDTNTEDNSVIYNGKNMYDIETGQTETTHYVGTKGNITQENYTWSQKVKAKIGLMYIHDVVYAYYDGSQYSTRGNPGSSGNVMNSWINFEIDGYNRASIYEWLITRSGSESRNNTDIGAWDLFMEGQLSPYPMGFAAPTVRPVFYLSSEAGIADGDGTKDNPYILEMPKNN